ncbi:MAG: hypothetical protein IJQ28_00940, partial [Clostridia bacterium]|nr:hypothetical protein [Clostridia bacterium]
TFMEWREPQKLFDMLHIVVVDRGRADIDKKADEFRKLYNAKITVCHIKPIDISSSKIRLNFKKTGTSGGLVPNNVEEYIISKKLYMEVKNGNRGN